MTGITRAEAAGYAAEYQPGEPMGDLARSLISALDERDAAEDRAKRAEGERDEARLKLADKELIYTSAIEKWADRAETAEASAGALTTQVAKLREALADIANPQRLTSYGDPGTLRDHAIRALKETPNA
jgi:hypothetical protein